MVIIIRPNVLVLINISHIYLMNDFAKLYNCISKFYENNNSNIIRNAMVRIVGPFRDLFTVKVRGSFHALDTYLRMPLTSPTPSNKIIPSTSVLPPPS